MCGFVGLAGAGRPDEVRRALDLIAHRGPDGEGVWSDAEITLGHRRLAIIDIVGGAQPFVSEDGRYVLAYNGEIYNFRELAGTLRAQGLAPRTRSDTEVLQRWIAWKGVDGLADLNGMFAFAMWDRRERVLLLARDRLGMKPLYLTRAGDRLSFASEIKALLPWMRRVEPDPAAIFEHLTFQNVLSDRTFFAGVRKLPPGGWLTWRDGATQEGRFWEPVVRDGGLTFPEAVETYRRTLERAIDRHMIADTTLGAYLSSGVDSGSVAACAARLYPGALKTFTGAFDDAPYYDERPGARDIAAMIGATPHEVVVTSRDFADLLPSVLWHLDEPTLGTGALPQFVVSRMVSRHVKVVLTGHGGDELFAGYQVNRVALIRESLTISPFAALRAFAQLRPDELTRVLYYLLYPLVSPEVSHGLFVMTPRSARPTRLGPAMRALEGRFEPFDEVARHLPAGGGTAGEKLTALYLRTYLSTLFVQEDKVGMAHSIEARMPLCDNELVDLALALPLAVRMAGGRLKAIPKAATQDLLPASIARLPKRGFPTPYARWFRAGPARELMRDLLLAPETRARGIVEGSHVSALLAANDRSLTDTLFDYARASTLYSYAIVELWHRLFADGDALAGRSDGLGVGAFAAGFAA